jgi:hypothetical protein
MKRIVIIFALTVFLTAAMRPLSMTKQQVNTAPPAEPIRLIFIHHSTGGNWLADPTQNDLGGNLGRTLMENNYYVSATNYGWGPDSIGDATDIPNWVDWFIGEHSSVYLDALYAEDGQNFGDFGFWPRLEESPEGENRIILFKSCFPNSELEGRPDDEAAADGWLTVSNTKFVYNQILKYFATRPDKLFVVITAPPLSHSSNSKNARALNLWLVNDWLRENNYTQKNVAVFDFYNVLTGPNNHHRIVNGVIEHTFEAGKNLLFYPSGDDHPSREGNTKATEEFVGLLNVFYNNWAATAPADAPDAATTQEVVGSTEPASIPPTSSGDYAENFETGALGWEGFSDEGGSSTLTCAADNDEAFEGGRSMKVSFDVKRDGWATCGVNFEEAQDWSASQGLSFAVKTVAAGSTVHVDVFAGSGDVRENYYAMLDTSMQSSEWVNQQIPWTNFKRVEWEENGGQTFTKSDQVLGIAFGVPSEGAGTLWVDDIRLTVGTEETEPASTVTETFKEESTEEEPGREKLRLPFCGGAVALPLVVIHYSLRRKTRHENLG